MKQLTLCAALLFAGGLCRCDTPSAALPDLPLPVKQQPLAGKLLGAPWAAASALVRFNGGSKGLVEIYETAITCAAPSTHPDGEKRVFFQTAWRAGNEYDFDVLSDTALLVVHEANNMKSHVINQGRVEIVTAPAKGAGLAKLRLRAKLSADIIEGEVEVQVCD